MPTIKLKMFLSNLIPNAFGNADLSKILIVNADDVGMHPSINAATFEMYDFGTITSMSVMANAPFFEEALAEIKKRAIPVGVHLTLTNEWQKNFPWQGVLQQSETPSLYNPDGLLWASVKELADHAQEKDVILELTAQIQKLIRSGIKISHFDTHMFFYKGNEMLMNCYISLAKKFGMPLVFEDENFHSQYSYAHFRDEGLIFAESFTMQYDRVLAKNKPSKFVNQYFRTIRKLPSGLHHITIHPAGESLSKQKPLYDFFLRKLDYEAFKSNRMNSFLSNCSTTNYTILANENSG